MVAANFAGPLTFHLSNQWHACACMHAGEKSRTRERERGERGVASVGSGRPKGTASLGDGCCGMWTPSPIRSACLLVALAVAFMLGYRLRPPEQPCTAPRAATLPRPQAQPLSLTEAGAQEAASRQVVAQGRAPSLSRQRTRGRAAHSSNDMPAAMPRETTATAANTSSSVQLAALVTRDSVRSTLGGKLTPRHHMDFPCIFKIIRGSLYRGPECNPRRPNYQLLSALLVSAVARAATRGAPPLPDVALRVQQGANAVATMGAPVLSWCAARPEVLALPSPYEADCIYHHRYVFTLAHHQRMVASGLAQPPESFPWASRNPRAVWRGTCTGRGAQGSLRLQIVSLSQRHPSLVDAKLFPCGACASLLRSRPGLFGDESDGLVQSDYSKYKYVLDLDGDGCSGRLGKLLTTGAVVLKAWTAGYPFYYRALTK